MASIKKVHRGMQNGAETINDDLEAINSELTSGGNIVHKTGNESIAGKKTFTDDVEVNGRNTSNQIMVWRTRRWDHSQLTEERDYS